MWVNPYSAISQAPRFVALFLTLFCFSLPTLAQTPVGNGSYATVLPPDGSVPSNDLDIPVDPVVTSNVTGPIPTTDWWTSIPFKFWSGNSYSATLAELGRRYPDKAILHTESSIDIHPDHFLGLTRDNPDYESLVRRPNKVYNCL